MKPAPSKPHGSQAYWSTLHWKVTSGSFEWNVKIASRRNVSFGGTTSKVISGGTPEGSGTYVHSKCAGVGSA
jgi:hypothetical protein